MNIYANSKSDKRLPLWIIGGLPRDSKEKNSSPSALKLKQKKKRVAW
ncbi:TPA: hypothetical protein ACIIFD_004230 [Salmonella enterica subsp. enterica serovar Typhimurium]|nr:hypothetical protein [Salmonella enterica]